MQCRRSRRMWKRLANKQQQHTHPPPPPARCPPPPPCKRGCRRGGCRWRRTCIAGGGAGPGRWLGGWWAAQRRGSAGGAGSKPECTAASGGPLFNAAHRLMASSTAALASSPSGNTRHRLRMPRYSPARAERLQPAGNIGVGQDWRAQVCQRQVQNNTRPPTRSGCTRKRRGVGLSGANWCNLVQCWDI